MYHIPNVKEASKYPLSNNNNAHSITKHGVLGRLDAQIVALHARTALSAPPKRSPVGHGSKKDARPAPGALKLCAKEPFGAP